MRILPVREDSHKRYHAEYHQPRIEMPRREYMRKARLRSKRRECERVWHEWDGPIEPTGAGGDYRFSYCRACLSIRWEA